MSSPSISNYDSEIKKVRPTSELVTSHTVISGSDAEAQIAVVGDNTYDPRSSTYRRILSAIREPMAEFFGVALLIIFGAGSAASVVLSTNAGVSSSPKGDFFSINFGWAIGIAMGVWVSGTISGGHINPAMTLAMATWRKFPWRKVPAYILAQVLGGVVGAALVYGLYFGAIDIYEGAGVRTEATAGIFTTYSTAYALNPARDFGPRLFLLMAGYGKELFTYRNQYWLWCPIIAPIVGAQAGAFLYDLFLYTGEGPLNPEGDD
ncbi:hypothetical protein H1R20_g120, partial [Candolleomyces eurysporus]